MNNIQNIGRIARYAGGGCLLIIGLFSLITQGIELFSPNTSILSIVSITISCSVNLFWIYASYALLKNLRDKFAGIVGMLLFSGIIALTLSLYQKENLTMFSAIAVVIVLVVLIIISWKMESGETKTSVDRARELFGEHINHLPDEEVHKMLKQ